MCVSSSRSSEWRHTANEHPAEGRITYRFHPRFGEMVEIRRRLEYGGAEYIVVLQPDGSFATLPAWMTDAAASRFELVGGPPRFRLETLRLVRAEVDALLSLLLSESETEAADGGPQINHSPTKSVRHRAAVRGALPEAHGRVAGCSGRSDARDRADAGRRKKRGGRS